MQRRTLENLILENEDYFFTGHLIIEGEVIICNGNIIVAGNLSIYGNVSIINGSVIVSETLSLTSPIEVKGGDIACKTINATDISITDGDIYVHGIACFSDIKSDGNVEVGEDSYASNILCFNYLVSGNNYSGSIITTQDVYILGDNSSDSIKARDVLIVGYSDFNGNELIAKCFECRKRIINCSSMSVG